MASIPNSRALTVSDGNTDYFNVNNVLKHAQLLNGAILRLFSDAYTTILMDLGTNGTLSLQQSATTPDPGAAGTIATSTGVSRVTPVAARTGVILAAGTIAGQLCFVQNEGTIGNSITFAASGTSNVSDGVNDIILGGQTALYEWNSAQSLWFRVNNPLVSGGLQPKISSATSPDPGAAGTIATAGIGRSLVTPAAARTGIILQAGAFDGQEVWVVNQGTAANSLTFNTTPATSNVADSATESAIAGLTARKFIWVAGSSLWYVSKA